MKKRLFKISSILRFTCGSNCMLFCPCGYYIFYPIFYIFLYITSFITRKKLVSENLRKAFPDKTDKELKQLEQKFYHHF